MFDRKKFIHETKFIRVISQRTFSYIELHEYQGQKLIWKKMKPNGPNGEVSMDLLVQSYYNYLKLTDRRGLVKIHDGWWDGSHFNTVMEYLENYERMSSLQFLPEVERREIFMGASLIVSRMMSQGYTDYDIDPTNFFVKKETNEVVMIDLDKIMKLTDACKDCGHYGSWLSTRLVRMFLWLAGNFTPHLQYTEVVKRA